MKNKKRIEEIKNDISNIFVNVKKGDEYITVFNDELKKKYPQILDHFFKNDWKVQEIYYNTGLEAVEAITWELKDCETLEDMADALESIEFEDIEADVYTSDLTAWLHADASNVYYLTEAKEQGIAGGNDGFELLQAAQYLAKVEIYEITKRAVLELVESLQV